MLDMELDSPEVKAKKAQAFKTIYRAISAGKTLRKDFHDGFLFEYELLSDDEYIDAVEKHCRFDRRKKGNTEMSAWILAQKYYEDCSPTNVELFNAIYAFATKNIDYVNQFYSVYSSNSGRIRGIISSVASGFFHPSKKMQPLTLEDIDAKIKNKDLVVWKIYYELAYPTLLGNLLPAQDLRA